MATLAAPSASPQPPSSPPLLLEAPAHVLPLVLPLCPFPEGLVALRQPEWLEEALAATSDYLLDMAILYRWPATAVAGGWAVGVITAALPLDPEQFNFEATYACDGPDAPACKHRLTTKAYARTEKSPVDSWALLGRDFRAT